MSLPGNGRILVAMSGGIDSSVSALLLKQQGWEIEGLTLRMWDYLLSDCKAKETGCCSIESINDARNFAVQHGFKHHILDCRDAFLTDVAENFQLEYLSGRTPNPCVVCNRKIKWKFLLKAADDLGCSHVATGHYAKTGFLNGRYYISKGVDEIKDQSYFLWALDQESIKRTVFPLGQFKKEEIRSFAEQNGLKRLREKRESMEVCFIPSGDYREFLKRRIDNATVIIKEGNFVNSNGEILGVHKGYPFYTVGQRKGLGIAVGQPLYVLQIKPAANEVVLGAKEELMAAGLVASEVNLMKYDALPNPGVFQVKIRYQDKGTKADVSYYDNKLHVRFHEKVSAVAPGQSVVAYEGEDIVAAGIIS